MTEPTKLTARFRVGRRFTCELTLDIANRQFSSVWTPSLPRRLKPNALAEYRAGRDRLVQMAAESIGGNVMVVEPTASATRVSVAKPIPCAGNA